MRKSVVLSLLILLLALLPAGFALAQTPTNTPTPTSTPSPTPTPTATPDDRGLMPVGSVILFGSSTQPSTAWLACDGSAVSRSTYAHLFAIIGTTYGVGDGSTTFNLPDFRGKVPVGVGEGTLLTNRLMGQTFGEEVHFLTVNELPPHTHGENNSQPTGPELYVANGSGASHHFLANNTGAVGNQRLETDSTGAGFAHNVMQPSLVVAYFIFAGESLDLGGGGGFLEAPTPDGATVYQTVTNGETVQTVAIRYEVTPGDIVIASLLFVVVGLILVQIFLNTRRLRQ